MKKKKIIGFVLGLIGSIASGVLGYLISFVLLIAFAFATTNTSLFMVFQYANYVGAILGVVAACFYFKKPRLGAILMFVALICDLGIYIYIIAFSGTFQFTLIPPMLPSVAVLASAIIGITCKEPKDKEKVEEKTE